MADPLVAQFCRASHPVSPAFIHRCQREFLKVQARLDELDVVRAERDRLKTQVANLKAALEAKPRRKKESM